MDAGYRVHLANTAAIVQYSGLKYSDDDSDAAWLAKLLRLGLLPEGYIYPKEQRAVRDLLRRRSVAWSSNIRPTSWRCRTCSRATAGAR